MCGSDFMDSERGGGGNPFQGQSPEDIFSHIFRDFNFQAAQQETSNVSQAAVTLTFAESVMGCQRTVEAVGQVECEPCKCV